MILYIIIQFSNHILEQTISLLLVRLRQLNTEITLWPLVIHTCARDHKWISHRSKIIRIMGLTVNWQVFSSLLGFQILVSHWMAYLAEGHYLLRGEPDREKIKSVGGGPWIRFQAQPCPSIDPLLQHFPLHLTLSSIRGASADMSMGAPGHPRAFLSPLPKGKEVLSPSMTVLSANWESLVSWMKRPTNKKFTANEPKSWQNQEVLINRREKDILSRLVKGGDSPLTLEPIQHAETRTTFLVFFFEA